MRIRFISALLLLILIFTVGCTPAANANFDGIDKDEKGTVYIDFSAKSGIPLFKKINMFSPSHTFVSGNLIKMTRDLPHLEPLYADNMRIDFFLGMGGLGAGIVKGEIGNVKYNFSAV